MLFFFWKVCWLRLLRNKSNLFITWSMVVVSPSTKLQHQLLGWKMAIPFVDLLVTPWKQLQSIKSLHNIIQVRKIKHRQTNCTIGTVNHLEAKASFHVWRCLKKHVIAADPATLKHNKLLPDFKKAKKIQTEGIKHRYGFCFCFPCR